MATLHTQCGECKFSSNVKLQIEPEYLYFRWLGGSDINWRNEYCPWEITCPSDTRFNNGYCTGCGTHYTNQSFTVTYPGYANQNMVVPTGATDCEPKIYTITLQHNSPCNSNQPNTLFYEKYGVGFALDKNALSWQPTSPIIASHIPTCNKQKVNFYNLNLMSFMNPDGSFIDFRNVTPKTFESNSALTASWSYKTYTVLYCSDEQCTTKWDTNKTCTYNTPCTLHSDISNVNHSAHPGKVFKGWYCRNKNSDGSLSACAGSATDRILDEPGKDIFYEFDGDVPSNYILYPAYETCSKGHYCTNGAKYDCPVGTTSDTGAKAKTECYYAGGTNGTLFKDAHTDFYLPATVKIYYKEGVVN